MKTQFLFIIIILLVVSGCQSMRKNDGFALVVTPVYLPICPEKEEVLLAAEFCDGVSPSRAKSKGVYHE